MTCRGLLCLTLLVYAAFSFFRLSLPSKSADWTHFGGEEVSHVFWQSVPLLLDWLKKLPATYFYFTFLTNAAKRWCSPWSPGLSAQQIYFCAPVGWATFFHWKVKTAFPTILDISTFDHWRSANLQWCWSFNRSFHLSSTIWVKNSNDDVFLAASHVSHSFVLLGMCGDGELAFLRQSVGRIYMLLWENTLKLQLFKTLSSRWRQMDQTEFFKF